MAALYRFFLEVPSKHEIQFKKGVYFSFDFGCYSNSIHLDIARSEQGSWELEECGVV